MAKGVWGNSEKTLAKLKSIKGCIDEANSRKEALTALLNLDCPILKNEGQKLIANTNNEKLLKFLVKHLLGTPKYTNEEGQKSYIPFGWLAATDLKAILQAWPEILTAEENLKINEFNQPKNFQQVFGGANPAPSAPLAQTQGDEGGAGDVLPPVGGAGAASAPQPSPEATNDSNKQPTTDATASEPANPAVNEIPVGTVISSNSGDGAAAGVDNNGAGGLAGIVTTTDTLPTTPFANSGLTNNTSDSNDSDRPEEATGTLATAVTTDAEALLAEITRLRQENAELKKALGQSKQACTVLSRKLNAAQTGAQNILAAIKGEAAPEPTTIDGQQPGI